MTIISIFSIVGLVYGSIKGSFLSDYNTPKLNMLVKRLIS